MPRSPRPKRHPTTEDPSTDALALILNSKLPHKRRWVACRGLLKRRYHQRESLLVLQQIYNHPDRSMTDAAIDECRQLLLKHSPPPTARYGPLP